MTVLTLEQIAAIHLIGRVSWLNALRDEGGPLTGAQQQGICEFETWAHAMLVLAMSGDPRAADLKELSNGMRLFTEAIYRQGMKAGIKLGRAEKMVEKADGGDDAGQRSEA